MDSTRRELLRFGLFGAGYTGLAALAAGVPASFLLAPHGDAAARNKLAPDRPIQKLIMAATSGGEALNANAPGMYDLSSDIIHPTDASLAPTDVSISGQTYKAAAPWATIAQSRLDRMCFFHHATMTNSHANLLKVHRLQGATKRTDAIVSIYSSHLAAALGTIQPEPVSLLHGGFTFEGRVLPVLRPSGLRDALVAPDSPLKTLGQLRNKHLDQLNAIAKSTGTAAQRELLDRLATTRQEASSLGEELLEKLAQITGDRDHNQFLASGLLMELNITPVVLTEWGFSGDNHFDAELAKEVRATNRALEYFNTLDTQLAAAGLADEVTFGYMGVFGRTLKVPARKGREHNGNHQIGVLSGINVKGGIVGGAQPFGTDWGSMAIDSATGVGAEAGDIKHEETLASFGKTLGAALGVPRDVIDEAVTVGKVVDAALVS